MGIQIYFKSMLQIFFTFIIIEIMQSTLALFQFVLL